jgi:hypothetical protein
MKKFTTIFCSILIGVMLGYAWSYHHYMPKIDAYKAALSTYQEYFIDYLRDDPAVKPVPHKTSKKYETKL